MLCTCKEFCKRLILNTLIEWKIITYDKLSKIANTTITIKVFWIIAILSSVYLVKLLFQKKVELLLLIYRADKLNKHWLNFKKGLKKYKSSNDAGL